MTILLGCIFIGLMIYMFVSGIAIAMSFLFLALKVAGVLCFGYAIFLLIKNFLE